MALRVCAIELPARWGRRAEALDDAERALASGPPVDLALLPEASLDGYVSPTGDFDLRRFAEPLDGRTSQALAALARRHGCHVAGPLIERADEPDGRRAYNALTVMSPAGVRVAHYRKRHPWFPERWATPGRDAPPVFEVAGAKVTLALCFDVHFLEADAAEPLRAADVLLFASAWVEEDLDSRDALLPGLARTFDLAVVNANWGPGVPRLPGQGASRIVGRDGVELARGGPRIDAVLEG